MSFLTLCDRPVESTEQSTGAFAPVLLWERIDWRHGFEADK